MRRPAPTKKKVAEIKSEPIRGQRLMWRPRTRAMRDAAGKRVSYVPTTSGCCHKSEINQLTSRVEGLLIWNLYEKQFKHFNRKCCPEIGYEPQSIALSLFRFDGSLCVTLSGVKCWDRSSSDWNQVRTWDLWLKWAEICGLIWLINSKQKQIFVVKVKLQAYEKPYEC